MSPLTTTAAVKAVLGHARRGSTASVKSRALSTSTSCSKAVISSLKPDSSTVASVEKPAVTANDRLRMIMFGKPGAGKGTLSARLVRKYDILALSTGDMLRQHIAEKTEVGRVAEEIVAHGGLLPDELMIQIVTSKLDALHDKNWLLDGFPRTVGQGRLLDANLQPHGQPLNLIMNIDVPDSVILDRISDRWVHLPSGRVYNLKYNPPQVAGRDDATGEPLIKRPDDNPEVFSRRLKQFYASTSPLLAHYSSRPQSSQALATISGNTSDEIWPKLEAEVLRVCPTLTVRSGSREDMTEETRKATLANVVVATESQPQMTAKL